MGAKDGSSPTLATLLDEWLDERHSDRGLSPHTEAAYRSDLRVVADRIAGPGEQPALERLTAADLTTGAIRAALADLVRDGRAASSRTRARSTTGSLCRWLVRKGLLPADPTLEIDRPALPRRLPVALTDAQLRAVLIAASTPDPVARSAWPERDRTLVAVLAGAGLRASELCGLIVTDITDTADPRLRVRGKGNKDRTVPIPHEVQSAIATYLPSRTARVANTGEAALFLTAVASDSAAAPLTTWSPAGSPARASPRPPGEAAHAFRQTYAVGLVRSKHHVERISDTDAVALEELTEHSALVTLFPNRESTNGCTATPLRRARQRVLMQRLPSRRWVLPPQRGPTICVTCRTTNPVQPSRSTIRNRIIKDLPDK